MDIIKKILPLIVEFAKSITIGWMKWVLKLIKTIFDKVSTLCKKRKLPRAERKETDRHCVNINTPAYYKPDPLIYSQYLLMEKGLSVTWDNPDIRLKKNGLYVDSNRLEPDTEYEIEARIWNASKNAPVVGLPVKFSYLDFGIGTVPILIKETHINLGVKGSSQCPAFTNAKWKTPAVSGHYCIQVFLDWKDDAEPNNNLGQENTNVGVFQSPAEFLFKLHNRKKKNENIHFEVDTYKIPELRKCGGDRNSDNLSRHKYGSFPLPEGWKVEIIPNVVDLKPNETVDIKVKIHHPTNESNPSIQINVNAFNTLKELIGGVTLLANHKN